VLKVADRWLCLGISAVAMGVLYAATPWCTNVIVLIAVKGLTSACSGFYDTGKQCMCTTSINKGYYCKQPNFSYSLILANFANGVNSLKLTCS
jgi:hypothetical protein